jgi:hypothetical protein
VTDIPDHPTTRPGQFAHEQPDPVQAYKDQLRAKVLALPIAHGWDCVYSDDVLDLIDGVES